MKLKPDADYALQISALAHDIERAFEPDYEIKTKGKFDNYKKNLIKDILFEEDYHKPIPNLIENITSILIYLKAIKLANMMNLFAVKVI